MTKDPQAFVGLCLVAGMFLGAIVAGIEMWRKR